MSEVLNLVAELVRAESQKDSLEIGTPSKGGAVKVYGDFSKPAEFLAKVENAKHVRDRANEILGATA